MNDRVVNIDDYQRKPAISQRPPTLNQGGSDGTYDGMDPWQQSVENRLGQLHTDVRDLGKKVDANLMWMLGGFITVLGALGSGFLWLADKLPPS